MSEFQKVLSDFGLGRVAAQLEKAAKGSIRLAAGEPSQEAVSRLGGRPNLPGEIDWPTSREGPLAFLAQFDLGGLPPIADLNLPSSGSLYFFYAVGGNPKAPIDRDLFRVLYSDRPLAESLARDFLGDLSEEHRWMGYQYLVAKQEISFPWPEDTVVEQLDLSEQEHEDFYRFSGHWIDSQGEPQTLHRI